MPPGSFHLSQEVFSDQGAFVDDDPVEDREVRSRPGFDRKGAVFVFVQPETKDGMKCREMQKNPDGSGAFQHPPEDPKCLVGRGGDRQRQPPNPGFPDKGGGECGLSGSCRSGKDGGRNVRPVEESDQVLFRGR